MWLMYSLGALLTVSAHQMIATFLSRLGASAALVTTAGCGAIVLFGLVHLCVGRQPDLPALGVGRLICLVILSGVTGYLGNWFIVRAMAEAPNPGLAIGVVNANMVVVTLVSVVLFGASLGLRQLLGVCTVMAGIFVLTRG